MSTKGFTLLEMLLVLSVISLLAITIPFLRPTTHTILKFQMETMYEKLLQLQYEAMMQKRDVIVDFHGNQMILDGVSTHWEQGIHCSNTNFHFTPMGTISHGDTLSCSLQNTTINIVFELGSGRMYVR